MAVPPQGYGWWYLDALEDGPRRRGLNVIAFIGSVFSPWYRWSGRGDPENHACFHVATFGPGGRWSMTDRGRGALRRDEGSLAIGASSMRWDGARLHVEVDELTWPRLGRLRGTVTVTPRAVTEVELALTPDRGHVWRPFAPSAHVAVDLGRDGRWEGHGYLDGNFGARPLEADFDRWCWGRFPVPGGARVFYEAELRAGGETRLAARFSEDGSVAEEPLPPVAPMRRSLWGVRRETRSDAGQRARQTRGMLDAPFYTRAAVETTLDGARVEGVHEALDLRRFRQGWLMPMIALRVPRVRGPRAA